MICRILGFIFVIGLTLSGCSTKPAQKFEPKEEYVTASFIKPPIYSLSPEHQSIAYNIENEDIIAPEYFPESSTLALNWINQFNRADIQVTITLGESTLSSGRSQTIKKASTDFGEEEEILRMGGVIQTPFDVLVYDRLNQMKISTNRNRKNFSLPRQQSDNRQLLERMVLKSYYKLLPEARQKVIKEIFTSLANRYRGELSRLNGRVFKRAYPFLVRHPNEPGFAKAFTLLNTTTNIKQAANQAIEIYKEIGQRYSSKEATTDELSLQILLFAKDGIRYCREFLKVTEPVFEEQ